MLEEEIKNVEQMPMRELKELFQQYFGYDCKSRNKEFLIARIIYRIQELHFGGLSQSTRYLLNTISVPEAKVELSPGMILERIYKNKLYRLEVYQNYFMLNRVRYETLSAAAFAITGQRLSGNRFFKLEIGDIR